MKYLLDEHGRPVLERFATANALVAFDYDGTLAPIAGHPDKAHPRTHTLALLKQLTGMYPCAVISGRARSDALSRLGNVQLWAASGNHGAEILGVTEEYERRVRAWRPLFEARLSGHPGVLVEDKEFSISMTGGTQSMPGSAGVP